MGRERNTEVRGVSFPSEVLAALDAYCGRRNEGRSEVVVGAVVALLRAETDEALVAGLEAFADTDASTAALARRRPPRRDRPAEDVPGAGGDAGTADPSGEPREDVPPAPPAAGAALPPPPPDARTTTRRRPDRYADGAWD